MPPTEKRGRVHTSTVTVAVLDSSVAAEAAFLKREADDFRIEWFSGSGAGGQHRNKHQNCCRVIHLPTGVKQERQGRSRDSNLREAKTAILEALDEEITRQRYGTLAADRKQQVGSGMRGDKMRTYRFQEDAVKDHRTGRRATCTKVMRGGFDLLW